MTGLINQVCTHTHAHMCCTHTYTHTRFLSYKNCGSSVRSWEVCYNWFVHQIPDCLQCIDDQRDWELSSLHTFELKMCSILGPWQMHLKHPSNILYTGDRNGLKHMPHSRRGRINNYFKQSLFVNPSLMLFTTYQNIDSRVKIYVALTLESLVTQMTSLSALPCIPCLLHGEREGQKVRL